MDWNEPEGITDIHQDEITIVSVQVSESATERTLRGIFSAFDCSLRGENPPTLSPGPPVRVRCAAVGPHNFSDTVEEAPMST